MSRNGQLFLDVLSFHRRLCFTKMIWSKREDFFLDGFCAKSFGSLGMQQKHFNSRDYGRVMKKTFSFSQEDFSKVFFRTAGILLLHMFPRRPKKVPFTDSFSLIISFRRLATASWQKYASNDLGISQTWCLVSCANSASLFTCPFTLKGRAYVERIPIPDFFFFR